MSKSAGEFVDGGSIKWGQVAAAVVGTWVTAYVLYVIEVIRMAGAALEWVLTGSLEWLADLVGSLFQLPGSILESAWASAASFVAGLGVFGLPVGLIIAFSAMWLLYATVEGVLYE